MKDAVARIEVFFAALGPSDLTRLGDFYTPDAYFKDPFNEVRGVAAIQGIFHHMFDALDTPRFVITSRMVDGDQCFLVWEFRFAFKSFRKGVPQVVRGGETILPSVLNTTGGNAIVDWVLLELRDSQAPSLILSTRAALLQRDGDVVDIDGVSAVTFSMPAGSYDVAVRHRNHLGVMTQQAISLGTFPTSIDLRTSATSLYSVGSAAEKTLGSVQLLWAGNTHIDAELKYTGQANDRDPILVRLSGSAPNNTYTGYVQEDVNLDGVVKYTGARNDRDPILVNIGGVLPTTQRAEQLP